MIPIPESPSVIEIGEYYDTFDLHYRQIWGKHLHHGYWDSTTRSSAQAVTNLLDLAADWIQIEANDHLIDVGCGYGASGRYLTKKYGYRVTGLTVARQQFEIGERLNQDSKTSIQHTDWMKFNGPRSAFDGLLSLECLSHISNKQDFFNRIEGTIKPGSRAVITFLAASKRGKDWFRWLLIAPICKGARFPSIAETSDLDHWCQTAKLKVIHSENITPKVSKTWLAISMRSMRILLTAPPKKRDRLRIGTKEILLSLNAFRLQIAYWLGAIQYRLLVIEKPTQSEQ